jgi:hypothetical protein
MYVQALRFWLKRIFYNPGSWMKISGIFLLCSLPLITVGWAWGIAVRLGRRETEERRLRCFKTLRESFNRQGLVFLVMGALDLIIFLLLILSLITLIWGRVSLAAKLLSALFFWLNTVILCSGMYRYPLAAFNEEMSFAELYIKAFLLIFSKPGYTFLFSMVYLSVFIISAFTGVGLFLFLPGSLAMLSVAMYKARIGDLPLPGQAPPG